MAADRNGSREEERRSATWALHDGVVVLTMHRPTPGAVVRHLMDALEDALHDCPFSECLRAVVDVRAAPFEPTGAEIRSGILRMGRIAAGGRMGLVVANDFQWGFGRMFGLLSDGSGFDVRPFRTTQDAEAWVRA